MRAAFFVLFLIPVQVAAASVEDILQNHVLPGFQTFAEKTAALQVAAQDCATDPLRSAYQDSFDGWMGISHLRFGPSETDNRAFAVAFWPDSKGFTPKALRRLIASQDAVVQRPDLFAEESIAARGLFALEFLLFDDAFAGPSDYRCALIRAIAADLDQNARAMRDDWLNDFRHQLMKDSDGAALQVLFKALVEGLEFTANTRLGRPMGTFERPRPNRAEARRSGRSARNVALSLAALRDLALHLAAGNAQIQDAIEHRFDVAQAEIAELDDPVFAGVATPVGRLRVEALQNRIMAATALVQQLIGPELGVTRGFNSGDGD